ncbi:putative membrane protein C6F6.13c [Erysiphe neolycopersici]|uniref:Putative membrane protein C6F6.13c n=1 Tax=Erysiphe neolycopersici TaxID=212602 RepID=A0A420HSF1_9PEZI|nr:putative membrane protein C6F6.13c [Erysiphe neolycopersici]
MFNSSSEKSVPSFTLYGRRIELFKFVPKRMNAVGTHNSEVQHRKGHLSCHQVDRISVAHRMPENADTAKTSNNNKGAKSGTFVKGKDEFELPAGISLNRVSILVEEYDRKDARSKEKTILQGNNTRRSRSQFSRSSSRSNRENDIKEEPERQSKLPENLRLDTRSTYIPVGSYSDKTYPSDVQSASLSTLDTSITQKPIDEKLIATKLEDQRIKSSLSASISDRNFSQTSNKSDQNTKSQGISEWSHQASDKTDLEQNEDEGEWQPMPSYAPYDIYDDDDRLIAVEKEESDSEDGICAPGNGYTRVQLDDDAESATSLDENTQYLFNDCNGTGAGEMEDEEQRDTISQLQATKNLLTEGQRIAYVGMVRLILSAMIRQSESFISKGDAKKETTMAAEAMKMWSQKMMLRLYAHMEISSAEQIMIEQLSEHGVTPSDLTATLMQNSRVKNPMAKNMNSTFKSVNEENSVRSRNSISPLSPNSFSLERQEDDSSSDLPPYIEHAEEKDLPEVRTPSQLPKTANLDIDLRWTVLCDLFLTLIADSIYDARSRSLLEKVGDNVGINWLDICRFEKRVTDALEIQQKSEKESWNEDEHKENRRVMALKKRYVMMGLATVGGSLVIGLSAGLLAPVIGAGLAAGFTTIGVTGTGGFLAGAGGAAIITSGAAASGGIIAVRAANRRTGAVKTFEYRPLHNNRRVNLIVTVSGWMTGKVDDVRLPYSTVNPIMGDIYSVLWEPEMLRSMGDTINILATEALTQGLQQVLGSTILIGLMAALQLPVVLTKLAYLIDNPWTVSLDRANSAGLILADSLIERNLGTRPITFVGYSLGSRVIFSCLKELSKKGAYGLVQNVYLFGSPVVAKTDEYLRARSVVAGRFVNGYATNDWILGYLFRLTSGGISAVAGLAPVGSVSDVENIDVTEFVPGHMSYRTAMPRLLRHVGWVVESNEFAEIEDPDPDNHQERQRELINEIEEARKQLEKVEKEQTSRVKFGFFSRKKKAKQKAEWETYVESKKVSQYNTSRVEDEFGNNHGVLFDVEAIRAELASEQMEVRELKSTLPPMKLDLDSSTTTGLKSPRSKDLNQKITNISSSVPDISLPFESSKNKSLLTSSYIQGERSSSLFSNTQLEMRNSDEKNLISSKSESDLSHSRQNFGDKLNSEFKSTPSDLKSKSALPLSDSTEALEISPYDLTHNAWADDDEFAEKEVHMTFA